MNADFMILFLGLFYAVLLVCLSYKNLRIGDVNLTGSMKGPAKWDPKDSWASNLTAVGAILATVISAKSIQDKITGNPSAIEIFVLSVFFAALSITAPFFFNATRPAARNALQGKPPVTQPINQIQGSVLSFLVVSALTLWGGIRSARHARLGSLSTMEP